MIYGLLLSVILLGVVPNLDVAAEDISNQNDAGPLAGTWLDNSNPVSGIYKWTFNSDGKLANFWTGLDEPFERGSYTIEKKWTDDSGNTWYQCEVLLTKSKDTSVGNVKWEVVFEIDSSWGSMEAGWSQTGYKTDFHNSERVFLRRE